MRNIDKKWFLFVLATIVSFYGIFYTLVNNTFAIKYEVPADTHFDDMNFYECVVDSYNLEFDTNASYNQILDYEKLRKLSILKCNKNEDTLIEDKIVSVKGIELLTSLESVSLAYNNISNIDLSNNSNLLSLDISYNNLLKIDLSNNEMLHFLNIEGNSIVNNLYVYRGEKVYLKENIKISDNYINDNINWNNENDNLLIVTGYDLAYAKDSGIVEVVGESSLGYKVINNINIVNIVSNKYVIDEFNSNIYVDNLNNFDINDIMCNDDNIALEFYSNGILEVKYNDNVLKIFEVLETIKAV